VSFVVDAVVFRRAYARSALKRP